MIERRKHRRIVTLKNFARLIVVALVALAAMNVVSELRAPRGNDYGRIVRHEIDRASPALSTPAPTLPVVREGGADALVRPHDEVVLTEPASPEPPRLDAAAWQAGAPAAPPDASRVSIVGDESGVSVVAGRHKLRGGFGRQ